MNAVVTGAAGFIGSHLCERLIGEGWSVTGIDAFTSYYSRADKEANLAGLGNEPRFDLIEADLVDAPLDRVFAAVPLVFHLAAQAGVRGSFGESFSGYVHDNLIATQRRLIGSLSETAEQKYLKFMKAYPESIQRVPQHMIASYLGITRETLSRLRRDIASGKSFP